MGLYKKDRSLTTSIQIFLIALDKVDLFIKSEDNKEKIADFIFHRYYDRYLKSYLTKAEANQDYIKKSVVLKQ